MDKEKKLLSRKLAKIRGWIQAAATLLTNIHIPNLFKGKIYQGNAKTVCVPGLNCYSCPAATGACPIGAFQAVVGSSKFKFSYYITGFFILLGVTLGRFTTIVTTTLPSSCTLYTGTGNPPGPKERPTFFEHWALLPLCKDF